MTISYPLTLPMPDGIDYRNFSLQLDYAQASAESPFTYTEQIYDYEAQQWVLNVDYPPLKPEQAKEIRAFILSLRGRVGTFKAGDPLNAIPGGSPGSSVLVSGNGQTGYVLNVKGLPVSLNPAFKAGDDFELNGHLYTVVKTVASNGSGEASLDIMPAIRGTITNNMPIITENPKGTFRLRNSNIGWSGSVDRVYGISFVAVEAK